MVTLVSETKLTLAKLADIAGVSTSTASRALKDNPLIKQETRSRIQALAKEHNFSINAAASRLRTQKTHVIAVILNLIDNTEQSTTDPFLLKLVGELNQALNAKGYELLLSNSFMASDDWANYFIRSQRADGIIVIGQGKSTAKIDRAAQSGIPIVVWGDAKTDAPYPIIGGDNYLGGYTATQHLLSHGAKRILFLGDSEHAEMQERHKGYSQAHRDANVPIDTQCTCAIDITSKAAYQYINQRIKANGLDFDGIVCVSDMVALGALKALKERYVGIPSDVGIVGYDDISLAELMHPSLTTVRQNTQQAAIEMVTQLLNQFENKPTESQVVETTLIARRSTQHSD
ncbi:Transcriptional regulator, LacI family protein [Alteromonas alvinellae]|jgi:DNA-binding LacI/PurR family transcriptional regulator|tara:strand:+ start:665 stop:1699 length:1035 start_codon:yes stop_codon:yes gene_type:complete